MGANGIYFTQKGDFKNTEKYFKSLLERDYLKILDTYGQKGVNALRAATPVDSGLAASSWDYEITTENGVVSLIWSNSDIENGINVVILVDRGHVSRSGSWVPGRHFINEAISPIIAELAREVTL